MIAAAVAEARRDNGGVIAVVDEGGNLVALERLDGAFPAGTAVSTGKARTAMVALPDFTPCVAEFPSASAGRSSAQSA